LTKKKCPRCGYEWDSRIDNPKQCPYCKGYIKEEVKKGAA